MSNVRFYRLTNLPSFDSSKHVGIFVHATGNTAGSDTYLMGTGVSFNQWLTGNHYTQIPSGLWFGGENGWELLSNDTTSGKIDAAIDAKIKELDVEGYAQATISTTDNQTEKSSTLTIKGIQEVDGKISEATNLNFNVAIDGVYSNSNNKIATQSTVKNAIEALDVNTVQPVTVTKTSENSNTTLTFKGVKEIDGKILQGDEQTPETFIVGDGKLKIQIGSADAKDVFSANAQSDNTIQLDGNVFKKEGEVFSIYTTEGVSSSNPLVTQNDINSLAGAMHYRGGVTSVPVADENTKKGDVWVVTTGFEGYEAGDMFIARADGASATFDHVQGNLTLGIGDGQIAKNDGNLTAGSIVVATINGIKTSTTITENTFNDDNNKRDLTYENVTLDGSLYHDVTILDSLTVLGKDLGKTINISSTNSSIEIAKKTVGGVDTGILVDLVWNTTMEQ